ncbi:hypothetical protein [Aegicerativicinus sediminis]|uniref:hypothetical protein n=1 Tax=Aegicerativicinus sediminis TaxID=2893202 RepID=UPI001E5D08D7|nr:hypothetical protein [Aegicerativicinus sediminis]
MKKPYLTRLTFLAATMFTLALFNCSSDDSNDDNGLSTQESTEIAFNSNMDQTEAAIADLVIGIYETTSAQDVGRVSSTSSNIPDCSTFNISGSSTYREVVINFGDNCNINGHAVTGTLKVSYNRDPNAQQISINYELENFTIDENGVEGAMSILFQRSNGNGNPQFTHNLNLTVNWKNGMTSSRTGQKVREQIEGAGTAIFSDNVYLITGSWTSAFANGNTHNYEVLTALRREASCFYFVSGTVSVKRTLFEGLMDFGSGECDDKAIFTFSNGRIVNISMN